MLLPPAHLVVTLLISSVISSTQAGRIPVAAPRDHGRRGHIHLGRGHEYAPSPAEAEVSTEVIEKRQHTNPADEVQVSAEVVRLMVALEAQLLSLTDSLLGQDISASLSALLAGVTGAGTGTIGTPTQPLPVPLASTTSIGVTIMTSADATPPEHSTPSPIVPIGSIGGSGGQFIQTLQSTSSSLGFVSPSAAPLDPSGTGAADSDPLSSGLNTCGDTTTHYITSTIQGTTRTINAYTTLDAGAGGDPVGGASMAASVAAPLASTISVFPLPLDSALPTTLAVSSLVGSVDAQNSGVSTVSRQDVTSTVIVRISSVSAPAASASASDSASALASSSAPASKSTASTATLLSPPSTASNSAGAYVFNAAASDNVAVYFGQTPATTSVSISELCEDASVDIVILAFVISAGSPYPTINFSGACGQQTAAMQASAPGLLSCPQMAADILTCQRTHGKKVLLSIGGAVSQIAFPTPADAASFADSLWQLFGPTGAVDGGLRPFGDVVIDGFDVDNEDNEPANFDILGSTLRAHFASDSSKAYYLSAAPQCPFPDASNPLGLLQQCDFVWVQFYNNPQCQIGAGASFTASLLQWSQALQSGANGVTPRLYVGAPAWAPAGPSAYASFATPAGIQPVAASVFSADLPNLGGFMFWDGPEGALNTEDGKDIFAWTKAGL